MKYIIQQGSVRYIYSNLEAFGEDVARIFRFLIHFRGAQLERGSTIYSIEG